MLPRLDGLAVCRLVRKDPRSSPHTHHYADRRAARRVTRWSGWTAARMITSPSRSGWESSSHACGRAGRAPGRGVMRQSIQAGDIELTCPPARVSQRQGTPAQPEGVRPARRVDAQRGRSALRDLILSRVWGYDYYGDSRTVDVHPLAAAKDRGRSIRPQAHYHGPGPATASRPEMTLLQFAIVPAARRDRRAARRVYRLSGGARSAARSAGAQCPACRPASALRRG